MTMISSASSRSSASVSLAIYQVDTGRAQRCGGGDENEGERTRRGGTPPLVAAMTEALRSLGWTAPAPAAEAPAAPSATPATDGTPGTGTDTAPATGDSPQALPEALAGFAEALAQALREAGPGRHRAWGDGEGGHHHHEGGHGWGRHGGGLVARLERVIGSLQAQAPAAAEPAAPAEPAAAPAPAAPAAAVVGDTPVTDTSAPAGADTATPPAAEPVSTAPAPSTTHVDVPTAATRADTPLVDAFSHLLDSLRDSGVNLDSGRSPGELLTGFLQTLADGLRPSSGGVSMTGLFIRITA